MKRFTMVLALLLMVVMPMMAERVTPETARKVASTFLNNNGAKATQLTDLSKAAGFSNLYIFSTEESFVVMAADNCVKPILGYSLTNRFAVDEMPDNLVWWLNGYNTQIQDAIDRKLKAVPEVSKLWHELYDGNSKVAKTTIIVNALTESIWGQSTPFNNNCPNNSVTGCVATAMAQILYYHKHPTQGIGSHSYVHNTYGIQTADFSSTTYNWNKMKNSYQDGYTQDEGTAVATLMYHCGVSVDMYYRTSESSAFSIDIPSALINYFNYSVTAKYKNRYPSDSTQYWIQDLKNELDAQRPMEYSGSSNSGGGHSFICDGYDSDNNFHFNWGWSGSNNGFFSIDATNMTYRNDQAAVFGIKPADCATSAPTNFSADLVSGTRNVNLSWDAVANAIGYTIFRNGSLVETVSASKATSYTYTNERIPYGTNVYYIRSVDPAREMSLPSDYKTISISFLAPTGFSASLSSSGSVNLSWNQTENAVSYNIYCNDILINNVATTSFEDIHPIPGNTSYYIKGVDVLGDESDASNTQTLSIPFKTPIVQDLSVSSYSSQNVTLSWAVPDWCYPQSSLDLLSYGNANSHYYTDFTYYGQRYLSENLAQYANKSIYKISTKVESPGTYTIYVYTNSLNGKPDPDSLADVRILKCTHAGSWIDIPLSRPILITGSTDLWIVIKHEDTQGTAPIPTFNLPSYNANACYYGWSSPTDIQPFYDSYTICWYIRAYLTDGTYTYNLYDGTNTIASNIDGTSYTINNIANNTAHQYTVKTNYNGGESAASNMAGLTVGNASLSSLTMEANDQMTITEGSKLTVNNTLSNSVADHLILENGAQLINDSEDVKATVKKTISPYTEDLNDGWHLIASPITESITPTAGNGLLANEYDLFMFNQSEEKEWRNYEADPKPFATIDNKVGYLYSNGNETTISFAGTLAGIVTPTTITRNDNVEFKGFNLIGNPYPCEVYTSNPFYTLQYNAEDDKTSFVLGQNPIPPCTAILVQAQTAEESVSFSKTPLTKDASITMRLSKPNMRSTHHIDQARISFEAGCQLSKYTWGNASSTIYIPQNGQNFAVAYANGQNEMPLNFKAVKNGTYTLGIEVKDLELDYLHLIDNMTGADVDLLATPSYSFEGKADDYESRFKLVFSNYEDADDDNVHFAYYADDEIRLVETCHGASLQVVDMMGRVIVSHSGRIQCVPTAGMTAGVYVLRLINGNDVKTQKIVIE